MSSYMAEIHLDEDEQREFVTVWSMEESADRINGVATVTKKKHEKLGENLRFRDVENVVMAHWLELDK